MNARFFSVVLALAGPLLHAAELTVKTQPFTITRSFEADVVRMPDGASTGIDPDKTPPMLAASVPTETAVSLAVGSAGVAVVPGREDLPVPATVKSIGRTGGASFAVQLDVKFPPELKPFFGAKTMVNVTVYHKDQAVVIPLGALSFGPKGWCVDLKLADGRTEKHPVTRGRAHAGQTEITAGLESGQVIVVP